MSESKSDALTGLGEEGIKITGYAFCFISSKVLLIAESILKIIWCHETELNRRHKDFQSSALPTELSWPLYFGVTYGERSHTTSFTD